MTDNSRSTSSHTNKLRNIESNSLQTKTLESNSLVPISTEEIEKAKINLETAKLPWRDLQRFFAAGQVFFVDNSLDITEIALKISQDKIDELRPLVSEQNKITPVSDQQAIEWVDADASVWCVVVKPYVLVQDISND